MVALVDIPPCVTALEARDLLREGIKEITGYYGDNPGDRHGGSLQTALDEARALERRFDAEVPWLRWLRDVDIPSYCEGTQEHHQITGALSYLRLSKNFQPQFDGVPGEALKETIDEVVDDAGDFFKGAGDWLWKIALALVVVLVVVTVVKWKVQS
jgi:hypothetical protein